MPTPFEPNERPSSAKDAAQRPSLDANGTKPPAPPPNNDLTDEFLLPARSGSTDSHRPGNPSANSQGSSSRNRSPESDIAQFLAHPQAVPNNTDDAPTVITRGDPNAARTPSNTQPLPFVVNSEVPSIAGRRLGHFELIEAVGAGGMAAVLKARDTELGRIVALKILPPDAARDPEGVNRFKQEARAAAALDHENIARVYYCGEDQGLHFIAFEFVEGINLRQMIDRRGVLPAAECVRYMMQVAAGLHHAAERGVVHRDIKPSNILITPDGRAKIVDMGLARHLGSELVNGGVTQSGVTLGTFDYISPEQALDPRRADVRSDVYSLGCTFYHALTGRPPVPEGTAARKLRAHQNEQPLDPRELNPTIPDELAVILARMMAKDPAQRYQSPMELISHLKGLASRLNVGNDALAHDSAAKMVPAEPHVLPQSPRFHPLWVLALAAVAVAVAAFVIATSNPSPAPVSLSPQSQAKNATDSGTEKDKPKLPNARTKNAQEARVRTREELAEQLEDPNITKIVLEAGEFDLTKLARPVLLHGKTVELIGESPDASRGPVRVILTASEKGDTPGTLTLKASDSVAVRNVWFELRPESELADDPNLTPVGLRVEDAPKVDFTDCVFTSTDKLRSYDTCSVRITREGICAVTSLRCLFAPNTDGLVVPPGSIVSIKDSGFGPHAAAVYVPDGPESSPTKPEQPTKLTLDHCSFMLPPHGAVVEAGTPRVHVTATDCVFAPAIGNTAIHTRFSFSSANKTGVVIRSRAETADGQELSVPPGRVSGFYAVDPLGTPLRTLSFADCKTEKDASGIKETGCVALKQNPWGEISPLDTIASDSPWKAFRLRLEGWTEPESIFTYDSFGRRVPMGVTFEQVDHVRRAYPDMVWASFPTKKSNEASPKIWWPNAKNEDMMSPLVYRSLDALLDEVRPGDVIVIQHDGELPRDTIELKPRTKPNDADFRVTFRAAQGCKPILTVRPDNGSDQTLFKLTSGEVTFEGIHFQLQPDQPKGVQTVAAVALLGGKSCTFRNCVFTLAEEESCPVAVVQLWDFSTNMAMMTTAAKQTPQVVFKNCLIRGKGRGVWAKDSRPLHLDMTNTLTALDGPVFLAEAGGKEAPNGTSKASFSHVTALIGGPLVEMHGDKPDTTRPGALVKLDVDTDGCLFVAVPNAGRPIVDIEGVDVADWKTVLGWRVGKGNRYAKFDETSSVLALFKPGGDGMVKEWYRTQWLDNVGEPLPEPAKRFGDVTFATPLTGRDKLATIKPSDVVVQSMEFPDLMGVSSLEVGVKPAELDNLKPLLGE